MFQEEEEQEEEVKNTRIHNYSSLQSITLISVSCENDTEMFLGNVYCCHNVTSETRTDSVTSHLSGGMGQNPNWWEPVKGPTLL